MTRNWFIAVLVITASAPAVVLAQSEDPRDMHHHTATVGTPSSQQPTGPRNGDQVSFCGKVVALVETGCIGIVGSIQTVEISAISPKPAIGAVISGMGTVNTNGNICMQGLHLGAANWKPVTSCSY